MPHEQEPVLKLDQYLLDIAEGVGLAMLAELLRHARCEGMQPGTRCPCLLCDLPGNHRRTSPHQPIRAGHQYMAPTRSPGALRDHPVLGRHHRSVPSGKAMSSSVSWAMPGAAEASPGLKKAVRNSPTCFGVSSSRRTA